MRNWIIVAIALASAGCGNRSADEPAAAKAIATPLAPGDWQIVTTTVPPPGRPVPPSTETLIVRVEPNDAVRPPSRLFGGCPSGAVTLAKGAIRGSMPCVGDGALANATVSINGRYDRESFDVTVDTNFMGATLRQERHGRLVGG